MRSAAPLLASLVSAWAVAQPPPPPGVLDSEAPMLSVGREPVRIDGQLRRVPAVTGNYWHVRLRERSPAGTPRRLLDRGRHATLRLWVVAEGSIVDRAQLDRGGELTIAAGESRGPDALRTLVLELPDGARPGELVLADAHDAMALRYGESVLLGLYLGLAAAMVFYNLMLFASLRDRAFLAYAVLVAGLTALGLEGTGLGWTVLTGRGWQLPGGLLLPCLSAAGGGYWLWRASASRAHARAEVPAPPARFELEPRVYAWAALGVIVLGAAVTASSAAPMDPTRWLAPRYALLPATSLAAIALALSLAARARLLRKQRELTRRRSEELRQQAMSAEIEAAEQLRATREGLLHQLIDAQEGERRRLAAELHDSLGQGLLVVKQSARAAMQTARGQEARILQEVEAHSQACIDEVRSLSRALHPDPLRRLGLRRATEAAAEGLCREHDAAIDCRIDADAERVIGARSLAVYRIVQEAMSNAVRHGRCRFAEVVVALRDEHVELTVSDDGEGFDPQAQPPPGAMGLLGVQARVRALAGTLELESTKGEGTHLTVRFPAAG
jgi:signal transduction histidine kinase